MTVTTVAVLSPGDMGSAIAGVLTAHGLRVLTHLGPRSDRTRALAATVGVEDARSLDDLVQEAEMILSVLVPAQALALAEEVAAAIRATGATPLYVDCNAIAPRTVRQIGETIQAAGGRFADAGIIGPPPRTPGQTRIYSSGPDAAAFAALTSYGLDVRVIGEEIGVASGLKMCYAALTKGLQALGIELLVAAERMGLTDALRAEQRESVSDVLSWLERGMPTMPPKAHRWVGEMEEIAATFADVGLTPKILLGAADIYRFVAATPIGQGTPETRDRSRDMDGIVAALSAVLAASG